MQKQRNNGSQWPETLLTHQNHKVDSHWILLWKNKNFKNYHFWGSVTHFMIEMILRRKKKLLKMSECSLIIGKGLGIEEYEHLFNCHWLSESFPKFYDAPERCAKRSKFWKISLVKVCAHGLSLPKIPSFCYQSKGEPLGNKNLKYSMSLLFFQKRKIEISDP